MKATWYYFSAMLFIMLNKMFLTFESLDEILKCDHSIARTILSYSAVYAVQTFRMNIGSV